MARQGDLVVDVGGTRGARATPAFGEVDSGEGVSDVAGSFGLKIRLMMALMTVMLICTDRRSERKMRADACGLTVLGRVAVDSWVKALRIQDFVMARSVLSRFFLSWNVLCSYSGAERKR